MMRPGFDVPKRTKTGIGIAWPHEGSGQRCLDSLTNDERCGRFLRIAEEDRALPDRSSREFRLRGSAGFRSSAQVDLDRMQPDNLAHRISDRSKQTRPGCRIRLDTIIRPPSESG